jgi:fatty acid synthase subunit alpha, fungi type
VACLFVSLTHKPTQSSFGFGQVGGTALVLHPRYLFGSLDPAFYEQYKRRQQSRSLQSYKAMSEMMIKNSLVRIKDHPPYLGDMEAKVLLNSLARATFDSKTREYSFKGQLPVEMTHDIANIETLNSAISAGGFSKASEENISGIGVDQGAWFY